MRLRLIFMVFFLIVTMAFAQEEAPPLQEPPKRVLLIGNKSYTVEIEPTTPLNRKIVFVFDKSGSMTANDLREAIDFVSMIISQPMDGFEIGIVAFANEKARWPGIPEPQSTPPIPPNWAGLPSQVAVQQAITWINELKDSLGGSRTYVLSSLQEALAEPRNELSIVVVSDGQFNDSFEKIKETVEQGQAARREAKLDEATIMTFCTERHADADMNELARMGGLGAFYLTPPKEDDEEEE